MQLHKAVNTLQHVRTRTKAAQQKYTCLGNEYYVNIDNPVKSRHPGRSRIESGRGPGQSQVP